MPINWIEAITYRKGTLTLSPSFGTTSEPRSYSSTFFLNLFFLPSFFFTFFSNCRWFFRANTQSATIQTFESPYILFSVSSFAWVAPRTYRLRPAEWKFRANSATSCERISIYFYYFECPPVTQLVNLITSILKVFLLFKNMI